MAEPSQSKRGSKPYGEWTESIAYCKPIPPGTPRGGRMYSPSFDEFGNPLTTEPPPRDDSPDTKGPVAPPR